MEPQLELIHIAIDKGVTPFLVYICATTALIALEGFGACIMLAIKSAIFRPFSDTRVPQPPKGILKVWGWRWSEKCLRKGCPVRLKLFRSKANGLQNRSSESHFVSEFCIRVHYYKLKTAK